MLLCLLSLYQLLGYLPEKVVNVGACLGRHLQVGVAVLLGVLFDILLRHLPLSDVRLVAHDKNGSVGSPGVPNEVEPPVEVVERLPQSEI